MGEPKAPNPKTWVIVTIGAAVIVCVGAIVAALIGILPDIFKVTASPQPTSFPIINPTSTPINPGPQPSVEPGNTIPPTEIPISSPTETSPGTILTVGQIWRQGEEEVILKNVEMNNYGGQNGIEGAINFELYLTNRSSHDISLSFHYAVDNSIAAHDNLGNSLKIWDFYVGLPYPPCDKQTIVVTSGETASLSCDWGFIAQVDIGNSSIKEIIVTVSGISAINNAQWRIPISHQ